MKILAFGPTPPPIHGMAMSNQNMCDFLKEKGHTVVFANRFSPRRLTSKLGRLAKFLTTASAGIAIVFEGFKTKPFSCYFGLSGRHGLFFELILVALARLFKANIILHHHSYFYINHHFLPMSLLVDIAGRAATHIFLSSGMANSFKSKYRNAFQVIVISNAGINIERHTSLEFVQSRDTSRLVVGMLSNISVEKGVDEFIEIAKQSEIRGHQIDFVLAGPFESEKIRQKTLTQLKGMRNIKYLGAVYDGRKKRFYDSINLFLFPTKYPNEAEPIVVLEAMATGVPVLSYNRGCIGEILSNSGGTAFPTDSVMNAAVLSYLDKITIAPDQLKHQMIQSYNKYLLLRKTSNEGLLALERSIKTFERRDASL